MPLLCLLFVFFSVLTVFLFSPVVVRYTKDDNRTLAFHFVFFSVSLLWKKDQKKEEKKNNKKSGDSRGALKKALGYAAPRSALYIQSVPLPGGLSPDRAAVLSGLYWFAIALLCAPFKGPTENPLSKTRDGNCAPLDLRLKIRFYAFLHTFLVFLAQYKKRGEKKHGRNKNE